MDEKYLMNPCQRELWSALVTESVRRGRDMENVTVHYSAIPLDMQRHCAKLCNIKPEQYTTRSLDIYDLTWFPCANIAKPR